MKKLIKSENSIEDTIHITMYLHPIFYENSEILSAVTYDNKTQRYNTDVNPSRIINGPLSGPGEELEPPIREEWESFIKDCKYLVQLVGFTIISSHRSIDSNKSEYVIVYGMNDTPCGSIVYDLRLSEHPLDMTFPDELKDEALEYLKMHNILSGAATKAGIDFTIAKVTVGSVINDTWNRAFNRLYALLKRMRNKIKIKYREEHHKQ